MNKNKYLALTAAGFFLAGCAGMTKNQAALVGASVCGAMGAGVGAAVAHNGINGEHRNGGIGAGIGLVSGDSFVMAWPIRSPGSKTTATTPAAAPTATPPPPEKPKPAPPPPPSPPPPPPAPKVERTIILDDVLFDFDKSNVNRKPGLFLDRLVSFMNENKDKKASLSDHTDNVGNEAYNQDLSERRAGSVRIRSERRPWIATGSPDKDLAKANRLRTTNQRKVAPKTAASY